MALVNTAHILARDGWRVLMVDFDLEAPGMTHFFADIVRDRPPTVEHDALDLLLHAKRSLQGAESGERAPQFPRSLAEYVVNIKLPPEWVEKGDEGIPYRNGRLDLVPATLEPIEADEPPESEPTHDYLRRMDELDLTGIFAKDGPRHRFGDHVRKYLLNARFRATGDVLFTMRDHVEAAYDIVLIDSRTGLNEISGLCIGPLCDALVICAGLNRQNIYGTRYFMEKAGLLNRERAKPFLVVAGPVPVWYSRQSEAQIDLLKRELHADGVVSVPYHPAAAINETVFVIQEPKEPISKAYEELAPDVAGLVREDKRGGMSEREIYRLAMDALLRDDGGTLNVLQEVAKRLNTNRLKTRGHSFRPLGFLQLFPSACTVATVPAERGRGIGWDAVESISLAAAVSAYRLKSDRPFRRAWKLTAQLKAGDDQIKSDWAFRLLFFQLRVLGSVPSEEACSDHLQAAMRRSRERKEEHSYDSRAIVLLDSLMAASQMQGYDTSWSSVYLQPEADEKQFERLIDRYDVFAEHHLSSGRFSWGMFEKTPESFSKLYRSVVLEMMKPPAMERRRALSQLLDKVRLPEPLEDLASSRFLFSRQMIHRRLMEEIMMMDWELDEDRRERPLPLGFWIEPLMASATAYVRGVDAVDETLGWIVLSRLSYGYAWRVLVDWRYLESVKNHPAFVEFLRQEDEEVEKIESAIDRGEFPL